MTAHQLFPELHPGGGMPGGDDSRGQLWSKEASIALLAALAILVHLVARYGWQASPLQYRLPLLIALVPGGTPLLIQLLKRIARKEFGSDLLAGLSIVASILLGQYLAGTIVVLMLSGGTALERYATRRASAVLSALAKRMPTIAHQLRGVEVADVSLDQVNIGDHLVVLPHEICPMDGTVVDGHGTMDESYLTGEPFQIAKAPGATVLSGAVNGETALTISAGKLPVDSRYARIMRVMQQAEANRPKIRRIADSLGAWYTLVGLGMAALGWVIGHDPMRFLAVLVIATPCPLLLAIPIAIIGSVSMAASRAIVIKDPAMLERIGSCRTVIFDKTGTLTYGKPVVTEILCGPGVSRSLALQMAASLEQYSKHPLAASVLEAARLDRVELLNATEISEKAGQGLSGAVGPPTDPASVLITGRNGVIAKGGAAAQQLPPVAAGLECILLLNGEYAAAFRFHDAPRRESRFFVGHLAPHHRVNKVMLVSGDREEEVRYLAAEVGITEILYGKSPEDKVAIVREESRKGPTLFLGDGINDAPAMQAATVGVAFGQKDDITAEAADAVVLEASLGKVDELIHIGRRMRAIALQSAVGGMALSIVGMAIAAAGYLPPVAGAIAQEVIDVAAVLNALRVTLFAGNLRDEGI
ncbi:MAG TPA: heavy metal translocating P-type ATPase [Bryobacteraceae bacterium]|nr:heavy metal translocating P-type ATPase [Bryobacteraceae bacterium]